MNSKEKQRGRLAVEISDVCTFESGIWGQGFRIRQIEAERKTALKPGFDGVAIRGYDLWSRSAGERSQMLVEKLGGKRIGLMKLAPSDD